MGHPVDNTFSYYDRMIIYFYSSLILIVCVWAVSSYCSVSSYCDKTISPIIATISGQLLQTNSICSNNQSIQWSGHTQYTNEPVEIGLEIASSGLFFLQYWQQNNYFFYWYKKFSPLHIRFEEKSQEEHDPWFYIT